MIAKEQNESRFRTLTIPDAISALSKVAHCFSLESLLVVNGSFSRILETQGTKRDPWDINIECSYDRIDDALHVTNSMITSYALEDRSNCFNASATFALEYRCSDWNIVDDDALDAFARINSTFNCWPYWREFIQSNSANAGLPFVVLPLLTASRAANLTGYLQPQ